MPRDDEHDASVTNQYARGLQWFRRGRWSRAAAELKSLLPRGDAFGQVARFYYASAHRALSGEAVRAGDLVAASDHLRLALFAAGRSCDLADCLAGLYARAGLPDECLRQMDQAAARAGNDPTTGRRLAHAQWRAGRREDAYMTLNEGLRQSAGAGELILQMGLFLAAEERYAEARPWLVRAAVAACDNPDAHYYLALAAAVEGDVRAAAKSFQRALDLRPNDLMAAYQLSLAARAAAEGGHEVTLRLPEPAPRPAGSGVARLAKYIAAEADFAEALLSLPASDADEELFALLAGAAELAISEHPGHADLHLVGSQAFDRLGQFAPAVQHACEALSLNPKFVRARVHLADLHVRSGRAEQAAREFLRAIADGADWPDVHFRAAGALRDCGRKAEAREHLQRALRLNDRYAPAAEALTALAA